MKRKSWQIDRRTCLRGLGATLALPMLDVMGPAPFAKAADADAIRRFMAIYFPHGAMPSKFWPTGSQNNFTLSPILAALAPYQKDINVLKGFANRPGGVHPAGTDEGNGIHARHTGSYLTAATLTPNQSSEGKANDAKTSNGVSVDQVMAKAIGAKTCVPSLALGVRGGEPNNEGEDQFGGVYMNNISWSGGSGNSYVPKELNPLNLFKRLTGCNIQTTSGSGTTTTQNTAAADTQAKVECDVMSLVNDQAKSLMNKVSKADQETLDKFFTSVQELSRRCMSSSSSQTGSTAGQTVRQCSVPTAPGSAETTYQMDLRLMIDLAVFAMQCDLTRISTMMIAGAFEYRNFTSYGAGSTNPHDMTHNSSQYDNWVKVSTWTMEQYAYLLGKMKAVQEGDKTLLDNSIVYIGSEFGDGSSHDETNLCCVVAGKGGSLYKTGYYVTFSETPRANLYLDFLEAMGAAQTKFGDSSSAFTATRA